MYSRSLRLVAAATILLAVGSLASAGIVLWSGAGTGPTFIWSDTGNWTSVPPGSIPGSGDIARFPSPIVTNATATIDADASVGGLDFAADGYTIAGTTFKLTVGADGINVASGATATISAPLDGTWTKKGAGTLNLTGDNSTSQTGTITVDKGVLKLSGANGRLGGSAGVVLRYGGTLALDNTAIQLDNRFDDALTVTGAGTLNFNHAAASGVAYADKIGPLTLGGALTINPMQAASDGSSTLTIDSIVNTTGGMLYVNGTGVGANTRNQVVLTTAPALTNNILPWAVVNDGTLIAFATHGGNGTSLAPLPMLSHDTASADTAWGTTTNARPSADLTGSASPKSVNSLTLDAGVDLLGPTADRTINIGSGGVLQTGGVSQLLKGSAGNYEYILAFGAVEAKFNIFGTLQIDRGDTNNITGTGGLTKSGPGTMLLNTARTVVTGGTYNYNLNEGYVQLQNADAFTSTSTVALNGATLRLNQNSSTTFKGIYTANADTAITVGRTSTTGAITHTLTSLTIAPNHTVAVSPYQMGDTATGYILALTALSLSGPVGIDVTNNGTGTGAVTVNGLTTSGSPSIAKSGAGDLQLGTAVISGFNMPIDIQTGRIGWTNSTSGTVIVESALLSGVGGIVKTGASQVTLTGANTFTGPVRVGAGILAFSTASNNGGGPSNLGQGTDGLQLSGGNLRFIGSTPQTTNRAIDGSAGAITLGAFGASSATITYNGAATLAGNALTLEGNATSSGILSGGITQTGTGADLLVNSGTWTVSGATSTVADDVIVTGTSAVLNLGSTGTLAYTTGTSNGLYARTGATINLLANDVNGAANSGGLDLIMLGDSGGPQIGTLNTNTYSITTPRLDLGGATAGLEGAVLGSGTVNVTTTLNLYTGTIAATLDTTLGFVKQGTGNITLSGTYTGPSVQWTAGELLLDFTSNNAAKTAPTATLDLRLGKITMNGNASAPSTQTFASVSLVNVLAARATIDVNDGAGQTATMNLGAITRAAGQGTLRLDLPAVGAITTTNANSADGTLGAWMTTSSGFVKNDGTGKIAAVTTAAKDNVTTWLAGEHVIDSTGYTGTLANSLAIGSLVFNAPGPSTVTLGAGKTLTVQSGGVMVTANVTAGAATITGGILASGTNELLFTHDGAQNMAVASTITGTTAVTKAGAGKLVLSGTNDYTGITTLQQGTLVVQGGNAIGDYSAVQFSGVSAPTLQLDANETVGSLQGVSSSTAVATIALGANTLTTNHTNTSTSYPLYATFTGSGAIVKQGAAQLQIVSTSASPAFTGTVIVNEGILLIDSAAGALTGATSFTVNGSGSLRLQQDQSSSIDRIGNSATVTLNNTILNRGLWIENDNQNSTRTENVGPIILNAGHNVIQTSFGGSQTGGVADLWADSLTRTTANHATALVRGPLLGASSGKRGVIRFDTAPAMIGGGGGAGTTTISIVPYLHGDTNSAGGGSAFVTDTGASTGLRPLDPSTEYILNEAGYNGLSGDTLHNVRFTANPSAALTGTVTQVNSLSFDANTASQTITGPSGTTLKVKSGAFLAFSGSTGNGVTLDGFTGITTDVGTDYIFIIPSATMTVTLNSPLTTAVPLVKAGAGTLALGASTSAHSETYLNQGALRVSTLDQLGPGSLNFFGGSLQWATGSTIDPSTLSPSGVRTLNFSTGGGTLDTNGNDVVIANAIGNSGAGGLTKAGTGTLTLSVSPTYAGPTTFAGGTIYQPDGVDFNANTLIFSGGTLRTANGAPRTFANEVAIKGSGATSTLDGYYNIAFTGNLLQSGGSNTLTINNYGTTTFGDSASDILMLAEGDQSRMLTFSVGSGNHTIINSRIVTGSGSGTDGFIKIGDGNLTINSDFAITDNFQASGGTITLNGKNYSAGDDDYVGLDYNGTTNFNFNTPGGTLSLGTGSGSDVNIGRVSTNINSVVNFNLAGTDQFTVNSNYFRVGSFSGGPNPASLSVSAVLANNNNITAITEFGVGIGGTGAGMTGPVTLQFGSGTNTVTTPLMTIGRYKAPASGVGSQVTIAAGGTLTINNGASPTDLYVGRIDYDTGTLAVSSLDTTGGTLIATFNNVTIGLKASNDSGGGGSGTSTATLTLGTSALNAVTANNLILGSVNYGGGGFGTLNHGGGTFTVANDIAMAQWAISGTTRGTLNVTGGTFTIGGNITKTVSTNSTAVVIVDGGTLDMTGGTIAASQLAWRSGSLSNVSASGVTLDAISTTTGTGSTGDALILRDVNIAFPVVLTGASGGAIHYEAATTGGILSGPLNLGAVNRQLNVENGSADADLTLSGALSGTVGFTKLGAGTLVLSGNTTGYTGNTSILDGRLVLPGGANDRLPVAGTLTFGSTSAGVLQLGDAAGPSNQTVAGLSGTNVSNQIVGGNATNSVVTINAASGTSTYAGMVGGFGPLDNNISVVKNGLGTQIISGSATYTGATTVNAGTLSLTGPAAHAMSAITIAGGATLNLNNGSTTPLTLTTLNLGAGTGTATLGLDVGDTLTIAGAATTANNVILNLSTTSPVTTGTAILAAGGGLGGASYNFNLPTGGVSGYSYSLSTSGTAVNLVVTPVVAPGTVYWRGDNAVGATSWLAISLGGTNWSTDLAGTVDAGSLPGATSTIVFGASAAPLTILNAIETTLDSNVTVNDLKFTATPTGIFGHSIAPGAVTTNTLTIAPSAATAGIDVAHDAGAVFISAPLNVGANQTWNIVGTGVAGSSLTVSGALSGSGNLKKTGAGDVTFTGDASAFTGALELSGGAVNLRANGAGSGAVIPWGGTTGANVTVTGNSTLSVDRVSGTNQGSLIQLGTLDIGAQNLTIVGSTTVSGTMPGPASYGLVFSGATNITGNATFTLGTLNTVAAPVTLAGQVSAAGKTISVVGPASPAQHVVLRLSNTSSATPNNFTGSTLVLGSGGALEARLAIGGADDGTCSIGSAAITLAGGKLRIAPAFGTDLSSGASPDFTARYYNAVPGGADLNNFDYFATPAGQTPTMLINAPLNNSVFTPGSGMSPLPSGVNGTNVTAHFGGVLQITTAGYYSFQSRSDDGSQVYIDGTLVVNNNFGHGQPGELPWGTVYLTSGSHSFVERFSQGTGGAMAVTEYSGPDTGNSLAFVGNNYATVFSPASLPTANFTNPITLDGSSSSAIEIGVTTTIPSLTIGAGTGATLTVGGTGLDTLTVTARVALPNDFTLNVNSAVVYLPGGVSDGGAGYDLTKGGFGVLDLTAANTYMGQTIAQAGTLRLSGANGSVLSSTAIVTNGGTVQLDNSGTVNGNRIGNSTPVTLNRGGITLVGNAASAVVEDVGPLVLAGNHGNVTIAADAGGVTRLHADSLVRNNFATALVRGLALGDAEAANVSQVRFDTAPTLAGSGSAGTTTVGIIPYLVGSASVASNGTELVTYDPVNNSLRVLNNSTEYATDFATPNANVKLSADTTLSASQTVNGLVMANASTGAAMNLSLDVGQTLTVAGGALISSNADLGNQYNNIVGAGKLTFGSNAVTGYEGVVIAASANMQIDAEIADNGANAVSLTKSGGSYLKLAGANTYTGETRVVSGRLYSNNAAGLSLGASGSGSGTVVYPYAAVEFNTNQVTNEWFTLNGVGANNEDGALKFYNVADVTVNGQVTLATDAVVEATQSTVVATLAGKITGSGKLSLSRNSTGVLVVSATTNDWAGGTSILAGRLRVTGTLPTTGNLLISGQGSSGAALEMTGTMARNLGTGAGEISFAGGAQGIGFGAYGGPLTIAIGGTTSPTPLVWGGNFPQGAGSLILNTSSATDNVVFMNDLDLNTTPGVPRTFWIGSHTAEISGVISDSGSGYAGIRKDNSNGHLILSGMNTFTGPVLTTVAANTNGTDQVIRAMQGVGLPNAAPVILQNGGVLEVWAPSGGATFTRTLGAAAGQIRWASGGGLSAFGGKVTVNINGNATPDTLVWGSADFIPTANSTMFLNSSIADSEVELLNGLNLGATTRGFKIPDNPAVTTDRAVISGTIIGTGGLTKELTGTLVLTGANTYSGTTAITAGTLLAKNTTGSATGTGAVSISAGAMLGGNGTIAGNTTVNGTLDPGDLGTAGNLKFGGNLILGTGATSVFRLATAGYDQVSGINALTYGGTLNVLLDSGAVTGAGAYTLFGFTSYTGAFTTVGTMPTLPSGYAWKDYGTNDYFNEATGQIEVISLGPLTRVWNGGAMSDANWNAASNWGVTGLPATNTLRDKLVFAGSTQTTNTNNIAGLIVGGIKFTGAADPDGHPAAGAFILNGPNGVTIEGKIDNQSATAAQTINLDVTFAAGTDSGTLNVVSGGSLELAGAVNSTLGLTKTGLGTAKLSASTGTTYSGPTLVNEGTLEVTKGINLVADTDDTTVGTSTTTATLITEHIRQDVLTINAGSKVKISATGGASSTSVVNVLNIANASGSFSWSVPGGDISPAATGGPVASGAAVPEPATWLLAAIAALAGFVAWRRRK